MSKENINLNFKKILEFCACSQLDNLVYSYTLNCITSKGP